MRKVQTQLLRQHLAYCHSASPFYKKLFKKYSIVPRHISMDNLRDIPLTDKHCLARSNDLFIAIPQERVADIVLSSGTTGTLHGLFTPSVIFSDWPITSGSLLRLVVLPRKIEYF